MYSSVQVYMLAVFQRKGNGGEGEKLSPIKVKEKLDFGNSVRTNVHILCSTIFQKRKISNQDFKGENYFMNIL